MCLRSWETAGLFEAITVCLCKIKHGLQTRASLQNLLAAVIASTKHSLLARKTKQNSELSNPMTAYRTAGHGGVPNCPAVPKEQ